MKRLIALVAMTFFTAMVLTQSALSTADTRQRVDDAPCPMCAADDTSSKKSEGKTRVDSKAIEALKPLRDFVGDWRGVGLPKRGSAKGAWQEKAEWSYAFDDGKASLVFSLKEGKYYSAGRIEPAAKKDQFTFTGTLPDGKATETFTGGLDEKGYLVVDAEKKAADRPHQITFKSLAQGDRLIMYMTQASGSSTTQYRLAQVGYTREGSNFGGTGVANACVVTGGEANRTVEYKGKKYYVCCKGCVDAFNEDPAGIIAEWELKKSKEKK